jgi:aspartyl-tRNA(Asn)/glutamyl-tRNA(Gln) amidotransferase subunit A
VALMPSIEQTLLMLQSGATTPTLLVEAALAAEERQRDLNSMAYLAADSALAAAKTALAGPLAGIPITIKDLFAVTDMPMRAGTRAKLPDIGTEGTAVRRLRQAGAIILGKSNMHEVALGITGENPVTGDVKNPLDPARQAGGSSSGAAAGVAAGMALAGLGSDTGGSVRIPAAHCGLVGFKPSHGRVPLDGALALSPTCDHAGPITHSVSDAALLFAVLADAPGDIENELPAAQSLRFGVPWRFLEERLGTECRQLFELMLKRLKQQGATIVDLDPQQLELAIGAYTPLVRAEAAFVHRETLRQQPESFSVGIREPLLSGLQVSASAYLLALEQRRQVQAGLVAAFAQVDALLLPTTPVVAPLRGQDQVLLESGPCSLRAAIIEMTCPFSLAGVPTLSLPFARSSAPETTNLPYSLQVVGNNGQDLAVLALGQWLTQQLVVQDV